jgi:hypothetical protein
MLHHNLSMFQTASKTGDDELAFCDFCSCLGSGTLDWRSIHAECDLALVVRVSRYSVSMDRHTNSRQLLHQPAFWRDCSGSNVFCVPSSEGCIANTSDYEGEISADGHTWGYPDLRHHCLLYARSAMGRCRKVMEKLGRRGYLGRDGSLSCLIWHRSMVARRKSAHYAKFLEKSSLTRWCYLRVLVSHHIDWSKAAY